MIFFLKNSGFNILRKVSRRVSIKGMAKTMPRCQDGKRPRHPAEVPVLAVPPHKNPPAVPPCLLLVLSSRRKPNHPLY
jgi:hypothetical protein